MCIECNKYFQNKSNLNRHIKLRHGLDDDDDSKSSDNESEKQTDVADESSNDGSDASSDDTLSSDESEVDVWADIAENAKDDGDVVGAFKRAVDYSHSLYHDKTYKKIKLTMDKAKEDDDMKYNEALDYAADKRKFLIARAVRKAGRDEHAKNDNNQDVEEEEPSIARYY